MEFICERIYVETGEGGRPKSFIWRGKKYEIKEVEQSWQDFGFSARQSPKRHGWRTRHHRNFFRVVTTEGEKFELYLERGTAGKFKEWILLKCIEDKVIKE